MPHRRLTYSIIIPVYNKWGLTAACLDALGETLAHRRAEGEVIVVDDASTDETPAALAARGDVDQVIRHAENTGFQGAAADGADAARGETLIFLNNDTTPQAGWLDALLEALNEPNAGIAGAMFLFPDGRVQEFGGIIWRDASARHIGAGCAPSDPLFARRRDVDYVSGAGMAIRKNFWEEIGGFDPDLKPAYYEDTDLCMKVRAAGKRVVVTPESRIVHVMGGSKDVDPRKSHDTMMAVNREKFRAKWKSVLDREHWPAHPYFLDAASDREKQPEHDVPPLQPGGKRLLFAYAIVPQFDRQSGDRRLYEIMRAYRDAGHSVTLLAPFPDPVQAELLQRDGIDVWHGDIADFTRDVTTASVLEEALRAANFDVVYFGSPQIARLYMALIRHVLPDVPIVTDAIDLNFHRMHRERLINQSAPSVVALPLDRQWELETYAASDALTSVSEEEAAILRASGAGGRIEVVSNFYSGAIAPPPFGKRFGGIIAVNMAHHPNVDALRWFFAEIWPRVLALKPDFQLTICGNGTEQLRFDAALPNVAVTGYLPSMDPVFRNARVNIAPLRVGAGVKGKVTEAMRNGLPTVTTPIGGEGLGDGAAHALLVESDPERLARAIVAAHEDEALWSRLSSGALAFAAKRFSRQAYLPALERLLEVCCTAVHLDASPDMANVESAFSDPSVAVATFNVPPAHRDAMCRLLRSEPSVGAITGRRGLPRVALAAPERITSLVLSRTAYRWATMRPDCRSVPQLLARMQEGGLVLGCVPELEPAQWSEAVPPQIIDVTASAGARPEHVAAIVAGVKAGGHCRLRIVPNADLSPAVPGEVLVSGEVDGYSDVRVYDGPVAVPSLLGFASPLCAQKLISIDPAAALDPSFLGTQTREWSGHRAVAAAPLALPHDVSKYAKALQKPLELGPVRLVLLAQSARALQFAWACGIASTRHFSALPCRIPGVQYLYASSPDALEHLNAEEPENLVTTPHGPIAGRLKAEAPGDPQTPDELFSLAMPEWMRAVKAPLAAQRSLTPKPVVFVLGMHRSGTSLVTAILNAAGVRLSEDLMAANEFNRMGYFESSSIAEVHDELLERLGSSWSSSTTLKPLPQNWWRDAQVVPYKERLAEIVTREIAAGEQIWGFKDPRTARLLPLWQDLVEELGLSARFLLAIRDPRDVAHSLHARDRFAPVLSELLWLEHNAAVICSLGEKLQCVVAYEKWFEDPLGQAERLLEALEFEVPPRQELEKAVAAIVSSELRHHRTQDGAFALPYSGELYSALLSGDRAGAATLAELFTVNAVFTSRVVNEGGP